MSVLIYGINPESALLESNNLSPAKTKKRINEQDLFVLLFSDSERQGCIWSWPFIKADDLGTIESDVELTLHWSSEAVSGEVAWDVQFSLVPEGSIVSRSFDSVIEIPSDSITGANLEHVTVFNVTGLLSEIDPTKSYRLLMKLSRRISVEGNANREAYLLSAFLKFNHTGDTPSQVQTYADLSVQVDGLTDTFTLPEGFIQSSVRVFSGLSLVSTSTLLFPGDNQVQLPFAPEAETDLEAWYIPSS